MAMKKILLTGNDQKRIRMILAGATHENTKWLISKIRLLESTVRAYQREMETAENVAHLDQINLTKANKASNYKQRKQVSDLTGQIKTLNDLKNAPKKPTFE